MRVSVVIPSYNEEKYLRQCLKSLTEQIEKADEIIVVDNNSTDKTSEIAKQFGAKVIKEKKQGMIFARNRGFDEAKYEIIARCDADTILPKDWIKKIKINFRKNINALSGPVVFYDLPFHFKLSAKLYFLFLKIVQGFKNTLVGPNMVVAKNLWNRVKNNVCLDDKKVHEDIDLAIHINKIGGEIYIDPSLVVQVSGRRIVNNPFSFFCEYPIRLLKTEFNHR